MSAHPWHRLLWLVALVAAFVFGMNGTARAQPTTCSAPGYIMTCVGFTACSAQDSFGGAQANWKAIFEGNNPNLQVTGVSGCSEPTGVGTSANCIATVVVRSSGAAWTSQGYQVSKQAGCLSGGALSGGVCTYPIANSACYGGAACTAGPTGWVPGSLETSSTGLSCYWGCQVQSSGTMCVTVAGVTSCVSEQSGSVATGRLCSPGSEAPGTAASAPGVAPPTTPEGPAEPPLASCGVGMCPGTVNGLSTCQACTWTAPGGGSSTTSNGTVPGGASTTTNTTCTGLTCTSTTTGANGGSGTITTTLGNFCASNPGSPFCVFGQGGSDGGGSCETPPCGTGTSSSFGGSCGGGFTCEGDAIQCAIAREQHRRMCELVDANPSEVAAIKAAAAAPAAKVAGFDGSPAAPLEVDIGTMIQGAPPSNLSTACPGDYQVGPILIPLSRACSLMQLLGQIAVAMTSLSVAVWLGRGGTS